jgi:hypothetical protein
MDSDLTNVLVLLITTGGTVAVAWIKMKGDKKPDNHQPPPPPPHGKQAQ